MNLEEFLSLDDKLEVTVWQESGSAVGQLGTGESYTYKSSVLDVQDGKILVYFPPEDEPAFEWIRQGQKLKVLITRSNGLWSFFSIVGHFVLKGTPRFWLKLPDDIEHIQRRKHVRVRHSFPLQIKLDAVVMPAAAGTSADGLNSRSAMISMGMSGGLKPQGGATSPLTPVVQSVDISAGGIRFKTSVPLSGGQLLHAQFTLTPEFGELTVAARVVYCFSQDEMPASSAYAAKSSQSKLLSAKKEYVAAMQFVDLPRDIEKRIIQECFHLELEQHRKGVR